MKHEVERALESITLSEFAAVARVAEERRGRSLDAEIARRWLRERDESRAHGDALARAVDAGLAAGDLEAIRDALRRYVNEEAPALLGLRSLADVPRSG